MVHAVFKLMFTILCYLFSRRILLCLADTKRERVYTSAESLHHLKPLGNFNFRLAESLIVFAQRFR